MNDILTGAIAMASLTISLFFLRFWRTSRDRLFLFFSMSFFIEGLNRLSFASWQTGTEDQPEFYLVRLLSYALIVYAILEKNRASK